MIGLNEPYLSQSGLSADACSSIIRSCFEENGILHTNLGLEYRPQQQFMAEEVMDAFSFDTPLLFEAGTGVGKSLAYLLPGIVHAMNSSRQMVLSTHTIALQEQIEQKDIPLCRNILSSSNKLSRFANFKHAVLIGRGNYLCTTRLKKALREKKELFPSSEQMELQRIADWAETSESGVLQELNPIPQSSVWEWVNADSPACNKRNCHHDSCFYRKARKRILEANLIIVNHSLLFALLSSGHFPKSEVPGILFPNDFTVLDEAHTVPDIATSFFGINCSNTGLRRQLLKLHNPRKSKASGLLKKYGNPTLRQEVTFILNEVDTFFAKIKDRFLSKGKTLRLQKEEWTDNTLDIPFRDLIHSLRQMENRLDEGADRDELEGLRLSLQSYRESIRDTITLSDPEAVYWLEVAGKARDNVTFRSAPLDIAPCLRERLFDRQTGLLMTSATLAEGKDMQSFKKRVGAELQKEKVVSSPFDYPLQMDIWIASDAPQPSAQTQRLDIAYLADQILFTANKNQGGTLVLFTSYRDLYAVEKEIREPLALNEKSLLCQGLDGSRSHLVKTMKEEQNSVLMGTDSFWTGIDVPGSSLSQLIITRIPFQNPRDPVTEARSEAVRQAGLIPFNEITLPDAVIRFRQGIGRLIRNMTDSGRLIILDSRILQKPYGKAFLDVLPHQGYQKFSKDSRSQMF